MGPARFQINGAGPNHERMLSSFHMRISLWRLMPRTGAQFTPDFARHLLAIHRETGRRLRNETVVLANPLGAGDKWVSPNLPLSVKTKRIASAKCEMQLGRFDGLTSGQRPLSRPKE